MTTMPERPFEPAAPLFEEAAHHARARQNRLTKPRGSLGRLEDVAVRLAAMQGYETPCADDVAICVFAGDHGVAQEGVSAYPQAVTAQMVQNFAAGGAAVCVLARELGAELEVVNLGTIADPGPFAGVRSLNLGRGTCNLAVEPALSETQLTNALQAGREAVLRAKALQIDLFIGGEMGIGNTTSATALACALLGERPEDLAGPGTGLDSTGMARKIRVLNQALERHGPHLGTPDETLRRLGGFEIAALVGSYVTCAQKMLPVVIDGYISSVAALLAARLCKGAENWFLFSHRSAEPGHKLILQALDARPLLDLQMRLGEGSGAASAVPLLRMACALHNEMATFAQAGVSAKDS